MDLFMVTGALVVSLGLGLAVGLVRAAGLHGRVESSRPEGRTLTLLVGIVALALVFTLLFLPASTPRVPTLAER
jgi:hypothetical protein